MGRPTRRSERGRWRPRPDTPNISIFRPNQPRLLQAAASLILPLCAWAVSAPAAHAAQRPVTVAINAWPTTLNVTSAESGGFIAEAELPLYYVAGWTSIAPNTVVGISGSRGESSRFRDASGDPTGGIDLSYTDWSVSFGRSFGRVHGIVVDGSAGYKQRGLTFRIPAADYRGSYEYGGFFVAAGGTLPLTPEVALIGQGMWGLMQGARLEEVAGGTRRRANTATDTFEYRVGGVFDLNQAVVFEMGYRGAWIEEDWDIDWEDPARTALSGPYLGARIRF